MWAFDKLGGLSNPLPPFISGLERADINLRLASKELILALAYIEALGEMGLYICFESQKGVLSPTPLKTPFVLGQAILGCFIGVT